MVKDCTRVTFPVMLDMAPYAFLAKDCYPYQLTAGISHPAIRERLDQEFRAKVCECHTFVPSRARFSDVMPEIMQTGK
jgi:hypothetical protein